MKHMVIDAPKQSSWLWVLLLITLVLTVWMASQEEEEASVDLLVNEKRAQPTNIKKATIKLETPFTSPSSSQVWQIRHREPLEEKPKNLFPLHTWAVVAPIKKQVIEAPAAPIAPSVPFAYVGKMEDSPKGTIIFLLGKNKLHTVAIGEKVDVMWRLDGEDINALRFTFLPLNLPQTLLKSQPLLSSAVTTSAVN